MATLNVTFTDGGFPANFSGDLNAFKDAIIQYLVGNIDSSNIILGKIGGSAPVADVGPWLDNGIWKSWNGSAYAPTKIYIGDATANVAIFNTAALTANRTITFPDKDGTIALTSDLFNGRATTVLTGTTPTIDWSTSNNYYELLTGNTTIAMTKSVAGQKIFVSLVNSGTSYTVTWTGVSWPGGTTPTQTASGTDLYILQNVAGTIYGRQLANFS